MPSQIRYAAPSQRKTSNNVAAFLTTQLNPNAMAASRTALPSVVPTTVVSAARVPSRAPVAMTSVTIGPGVMTRTAVITRKAANSSQFMTTPNLARLVQIHTDHGWVAQRSRCDPSSRLGRGSRSSLPPTISALRPDDMLSALAAVLVAFLADALDRDHPLALRGVEHDHTLGRAPGDADAFDARADELAAVGHQHELVPVLDRERRDQLAGFLPDRAVALAHIHGDNAFSAAAGDAVFVGRG